VALEDPCGGFEWVWWCEEEGEAEAFFKKLVEEGNYPDENGRDLMLLHVVQRASEVGES